MRQRLCNQRTNQSLVCSIGFSKNQFWSHGRDQAARPPRWHLPPLLRLLQVWNHRQCPASQVGDGEPGITHLGITESGITESDITWVMGIRHNRNWYNGISYNIEVECGITESGITESGITRKFDSGIRHNNKRESGITESSITESGIT